MTDPTGRARRRRTASIAASSGGTLTYAAAPFAPTSYARLRLLRQMHACGLLSGPQAHVLSDAAAAARRGLADGPGPASC